ncbi:MAG: CocE/NonD family hydrolase [Candidatus Acidiferrum sp.]|jgi:alpha-beta hydrolase superfamily lysophospholipase
MKTSPHPLKRRLIRIALIVLVFPPLLAAVGGWFAGPAFLHPIRRELTPDLIRESDADFAAAGAKREDFDVAAPDGSTLRGWKVRPQDPNGSWVLVFHGVADNRVGGIGQAEMLLRAGYSVVMMDARAHGASDGAMATYGWLERRDTSAVISKLIAGEVSCENRGALLRPPAAEPGTGPPCAATPERKAMHIFALGESMGAGIALESAGGDPRIEGVVAEASFASLHEAAYDYVGLQKYPLLGKTFFAPGAWTMVWHGQRLAGFPASEVSPEKAVAARAFPVLLICDGGDTTLPCRHSQTIFAAATGAKELWVVPNAFHTGAMAYQPAEFQRRVLAFFAALAAPHQNRSVLRRGPEGLLPPRPMPGRIT